MTGVASVLPDQVEWKVRVGERVAHAFSTGPGWIRSICRAERWTVALVERTEDVGECTDCALLVTGAPGEITEAYGR